MKKQKKNKKVVLKSPIRRFRFNKSTDKKVAEAIEATENRVRKELGGLRQSVLWGDSGLIAAVKRAASCADLLELMELHELYLIHGYEKKDGEILRRWICLGNNLRVVGNTPFEALEKAQKSLQFSQAVSSKKKLRKN
jgi:hypothetical protein